MFGENKNDHKIQDSNNDVHTYSYIKDQDTFCEEVYIDAPINKDGNVISDGGDCMSINEIDQDNELKKNCKYEHSQNDIENCISIQSFIEIIKGEILTYTLDCDHDKSCIDQNGMKNCNTENDNSISNNDEHQVMGILR